MPTQAGAGTPSFTGTSDLPGGSFNSEATGISPDGSVVIGSGVNASFQFEPFRLEGGVMTSLGNLPGGAVFAKGLAVSGDGSVIVGVGTVVNFLDTAFIWTAGGGIRSLKDVLETDFGLDLTGWQLTEARGISDDGMTVVGSGRNPDGFSEGWIATLGDLGGGCDPLVDCSGNGVCDPATDLCICDAGWTGPSCDVPVCNPVCVNGQCVAPDLCVCDVGWTGDDCSVPLVLDAFIDVRPDRCPNAISIAGAGNLPMLMIGAAAFDVADVNLDSLLLHRADGVGGSVAPMARAGGVRARFADRGTPPEAPCACGSAGPDGLTDALINFRLTTMIDLLELGAEPTGTIVSVLLTGELVNGLPFSAEDCITIRP